MTLAQLATLCGGNLIGDPALFQTEIEDICIDSRTVLQGSVTCFFALDGKRRNGQQYVQECHQKGVQLFVVPTESSLDGLSHPFAALVAPNVQLALQALASAHRHQFHYPVVGITGSNGKTIVKEWLGQMLALFIPVVKSPRSFNSQLGVPLSLWRMKSYHMVAIIEAGISQPGEMSALANMVEPTLGIFTRLGAQHDESFESRIAKFEEKWKLYQSASTVIIPKDEYDKWQAIIKPSEAEKQILVWQISHPVTLLGEGLFSVGVDFASKSYSFVLPFSDSASVDNAISAAIAFLALGFAEEQLATALRQLRPIGMRLEWKVGHSGVHILDDTWTNDIDGLSVALQQFAGYAGPAYQRILILSDILQSGLEASQLYTQVAAICLQSKINTVIGIGTSISAHIALFANGLAFPSVEAFLTSSTISSFRDCYILVKGSRTQRFERIVNRLEKSNHGTRLEISMNALVSNLNYHKSLIKPKVRLMVMVKASAYGSGSFEVASLLQFHRVDYLSVAYPDEGVELRRHGITIPIMVMNSQANHYEQLIRHGLEPVIFDIAGLQSWLAAIEDQAQAPKIHLEFDTGMNRLGFEEADMPAIRQLLTTRSAIKIASVFSHLSAAEDPAADAHTVSQIARFRRLSGFVADCTQQPFLMHLLNTAGIARFPEAQFDMVRLGIGLYGVEVTNVKPNPLETVGRLKTSISQIRIVEPGETIGYGCKTVVLTRKRIATISIGYADGFARALGNGRSHVRIADALCPTIGNVCMDMTMIDISAVDNAAQGDEVVIFDDTLRIETMAEAAGTIAYEILTRISQRVKRIFISE